MTGDSPRVPEAAQSESPSGVGAPDKERPDARAGQRVTHGRHCLCTACAQEDWTRITAPCGMHGAGCPAVYAPISDDSEKMARLADFLERWGVQA